jgi:hypothetical protein
MSSDGALDFIFALNPSQVKRLEDPVDCFISEVYPFVESHPIALILTSIVVGWALLLRH